jgi:gamma-glutamylcyclotransferase (GGCT)/AIG2-like uncharacterized protein YtfP
VFVALRDRRNVRDGDRPTRGLALTERRDSLLFVYGTLRAFVDIPMARRLRRGARHLGAARTRGRLYDVGDYPGLTAARRRGEWVVGDLYELAAPRALLRALDRYEAGAAGRERARFVRVRASVLRASVTGASVMLGRGARRSAWLYLYRPPVRAHTRIRCGDYERYLASPNGDPAGLCQMHLARPCAYGPRDGT